jgi:hypothetical protein
MATRMQQRRGTAAQWTAANPVLAAGEIGFETDNNRFKIGNGATAWTALDYFANSAALSALLDGAPELLDTLNELAAAMGDDPQFFITVQSNLDSHESDTTNVHGIADTSALATTANTATAISTAVTAHNDETTNVHGIADTTALATTADTATAISTAVTAHNDETENVHGITDTSLLATTEYVDNALSDVTGDYSLLAGSGLAWNADTEALDVDSTIATASSLTDHNSETTNVHGITDTSALATTSDVSNAQTAAESSASGYVSTHNSETTNVHGIADTEELATKTYADDAADTAEADAITAAGTEADTKISTAVAALTKSSVGLANVDNTADADKPVSTATQTALDLKANLAGPTFTGTVTSTGALVVEGNLTVSGTTTTVNAADLSITDPLIYLASNQYTEDVLDVGFLAATGAPGGTEADHLHSGFFRDASDSKKWKLVSNVPHPVGNVVDTTNATRETLVVGALEATTVTPSSGVVFSDGTQTKEGVPSRTPIVQKTASYALSTLTHRDSMIEVSSASATTITIPLDSTVDYPIGTTIDILQTNTGQVTIAPVSGSVTVNATPGLKLRTRWSSATLMKRAANTWVVYGDLTA